LIAKHFALNNYRTPKFIHPNLIAALDQHYPSTVAKVSKRFTKALPQQTRRIATHGLNIFTQPFFATIDILKHKLANSNLSDVFGVNSKK
jgi:hypothetical protein